MPLNLPSNAHGTSYSDFNTVIPELVQRLNYEKGPHYARVDQGNEWNLAHWRTLLAQPVRWPLALAYDKAGNII